jgi:hypothetical protein
VIDLRSEGAAAGRHALLRASGGDGGATAASRKRWRETRYWAASTVIEKNGPDRPIYEEEKRD